MDNDKILVSYLLFSYNQEKFIKEAVESALAQTYSPLEIIISDDCSTDKTFEIIKKTVAEYKGPHKIILNRNEHNLGIAFHVNKVMSMAKGELWIMAAGDDISYSYRTEIIYKYWQKYKNIVYYFTSSMIGIDSEGHLCSKADKLFYNELEQLEIEDYFTKVHWCGAGAAIDRKLYDIYGPIDFDFNEDRCFLSRSWFIGKTLGIREVLLEYRFGGISTNKPDNIKAMILDTKWNMNCYLQIQKDLKKVNLKLNAKKIIIFLTKLINIKICIFFIIVSLFLKKYIII